MEVAWEGVRVVRIAMSGSFDKDRGYPEMTTGSGPSGRRSIFSMSHALVFPLYC